ncbi:hypothetical protein BKA80DRAFT_273032, partial [Phyllosticta citrichinensis]
LVFFPSTTLKHGGGRSMVFSRTLACFHLCFPTSATPLRRMFFAGLMECDARGRVGLDLQGCTYRPCLLRSTPRPTQVHDGLQTMEFRAKDRAVRHMLKWN